MSAPINDGGPAFPCQNLFADNPTHDAVAAQIRESNGMSLRDWFAGQALASMDTARLIAEAHEMEDVESFPSKSAQLAYVMADAMLKAREAK